MSAPGRPIESPDELIQYFHDAETAPDDWRVGTEHEKIGLLADTYERIPFDGERGIERLLERIAVEDDWERVHERDRLIALKKDGASITLEPGGQMELSGAPLRTTAETCAEFSAHLDLMKRVSEDQGIVWLALGGDPLHDVSEIPRMPKARYDIMREYLPRQGALALDMMHATATVQANYDYADEADMAAKMRTAMACTGVVSAIFANSPLTRGEPNGYVSRRVEIWRNTDPDRCGLLHFVFDPGFGYREYAEWALDIPMFFIVRDGRYIPGGRTTFREFMKHGFEGERATIADWDTHLTTLFPEVRLKRIIEVRGADAVPPRMICALPALWKGILYDADACAAAWGLCRDFGREALEAGRIAVAREGLGAEFGGRPVLELARALVDISRDGLRRWSAGNAGAPDEAHFLDPIDEQLALGASPGEIVLEHWQGDWGGSRERLIEWAKY